MEIVRKTRLQIGTIVETREGRYEVKSLDGRECRECGGLAVGGRRCARCGESDPHLMGGWVHTVDRVEEAEARESGAPDPRGDEEESVEEEPVLLRIEGRIGDHVTRGKTAAQAHSKLEDARASERWTVVTRVGDAIVETEMDRVDAIATIESLGWARPEWL